MRSCFPEEYGEFAKLEEDVFFGLVYDMSSEVLSHNAVPAASVLIHFSLEVAREDAFLFLLFKAFPQSLAE